MFNHSSRQSFLSVALLIGLMFPIGCKDNSTNSVPQISTNQIVPLKVGNQWNLTVNSYDSSNVLQSGNISIMILRDTVIAGQRWYEMPIHLLCQNDSIGLTIYSESSNQLMFKYPAKVGEVYFNYGDTVTVVNVDTLITVPAGTFKCYQYHYKSNSSWFISPGVGFIKYEATKLSNANTLMVYYWETLSSIILK